MREHETEMAERSAPVLVEITEPIDLEAVGGGFNPQPDPPGRYHVARD